MRKAPGGEPDVVGTVSVVRGFYDFQGRRFEVLRDSQIRFQGMRPVDPALQVDAQRAHLGRYRHRQHSWNRASAAGAV